MNLWVLVGLLVAGIGAMLVCQSLMLPLTSEEQPYVAAGATAAREAQWPVRDFAFFGMPALAVVYAGLFKITDTVMPAARLSSAIAASLVAALLLWVAARRLDAVTALGRFAMAAAAAALLVTCPLFYNVTGHALPHDLASLAAVGGIALGMGAIRGSTPRRTTLLVIAAGLCIGAASSLRFIYAPLVIVLAVLLPCMPKASIARRVAIAAAFLASVAAALAPTYLLVNRTPDVLWFATSEHAMVQAFRTGSLSLANTFASDQQIWMLQQIVSDPSVLVLLVAFVGSLTMAILVVARASHEKRPGPIVLEMALAGAAAFVTALMGYLCTPASRLHLFAAIPLIVLTCILCTAYLRQHAGERARVVATTLYLGATLAVIVPGVQEWSERLKSFDYNRTPIAAHVAQARQLRGAISAGYVLTLEPLVPLEAGVQIYPKLVMGEAVWRYASSMSERECARLGLVTAVQLGSLVKEHPPVAVMVKESPTRAEQPLLSYIRYHRFRKQPLPSGNALWVPNRQSASATPAGK